MAGRRYKVSADDAALFRRAVGDVQRLRHDRVDPVTRRPRPTPFQTRREHERAVRDMMSDAYDPAEFETGEELLFARPGLQHRLLRRLRRGEFSIQAELDLHGKTVLEARAALAEFLHRCRRTGVRCVRIIHGKGRGSRHQRPVLKHKVNSWLQQRQEILAFCSARPVDGGTGALYVLLGRG